MTTLGTNALTLADLMATLDPDGGQANIIEMLLQKNDLVDDIMWVEGNLPTGDRITLRATEPTVSSRELNAGVTPGKSVTEQVTETCCLLESYNPIDKVLVDLAPNPAGFRASQDKAFMSAFTKKLAGLAIYGNATITTSDFTGLAPRYNDLDGATGQNIIDAGGSGSDLASVWFIGHGEEGLVGIYPRNGTAGLQMEDKGETIWQTSTTFGAATSAFRAYVTWFEWQCGISLRNWLNVVRIANIDVSDAQTGATTQAITAGSPAATFLLNLMIQAQYKVQNKNLKYVYYANRSIAFALHILAMNRAYAQLTIEKVDGRPVTLFGGYPVRILDQLTVAEVRVTVNTVSI
jgi:hypothetical protein